MPTRAEVSNVLRATIAAEDQERRRRLATHDLPYCPEKEEKPLEKWLPILVCEGSLTRRWSPGSKTPAPGRR
jgi:hypothetical protein